MGWAPGERTLQRHFADLGLTVPALAGGESVFGRFEADRPYELWTGDALHGPVVARQTMSYELWQRAVSMLGISAEDLGLSPGRPRAELDAAVAIDQASYVLFHRSRQRPGPVTTTADENEPGEVIANTLGILGNCRSYAIRALATVVYLLH
jgi:hypothetical protein